MRDAPGFAGCRSGNRLPRSVLVGPDISGTGTGGSPVLPIAYGHGPGGLAELDVVGSQVQVVFSSHEASMTQEFKNACCRAT